MLSLVVQTPTLECNRHCVSFSLINLLVCHCVSCSCSPFEIHLSINFCLMPQSNHAKCNQSQTMMFQRGAIHQHCQMGHMTCFHSPPLIRHPMYHLFLSALFMSPNSQTGACT